MAKICPVCKESKAILGFMKKAEDGGICSNCAELSPNYRTESFQTLKGFWLVNEDRKRNFRETSVLKGFLTSKVLIDQRNGFFCFVRDGKPENICFSFDEVAGYRFVQLPGTKVTKSKGGIGRALVGGAVFGPVGAVVGATTGKKVTKEMSGSTVLEISLESFSGKMTKKMSNPPPGFTEFLDKCIGEKSHTGKGVSSPSIADELKKYKGLLDDGTITLEEFEEIKKRLLVL